MNEEPAFLYNEYVFTSFVKSEKYFGERHLESLKEQVENYFGIDDSSSLMEQIKKALKACEINKRIRINVFEGKRQKICNDSFDVDNLNFSIILKDKTFSSKEVSLKTYYGMRSPELENIKISNYVGSFYLKREAKSLNFDDILYKTIDEEILETSTSNIFFKNSKGWFTPKRYIYKGNTRKILIDTYKAKETVIKYDDLSMYTDAFICNSITGKQKVLKIDNFYFTNTGLDL